MRNVYLGIDIGTQSIRIIAFDAEGNQLADATQNQYMDNVRTGWATEKPEIWWEKIILCLKEIFKVISPEVIKGIGVDGVTHSPVPVDINGNLLQEDVQLYCDKRGAEIVERFRKNYKEAGVFDATHNAPTANWMGIKIRWIIENEPEIYERTYKFLSAKDYINLKLTGEFCTDPSEASGTMLLDHETSTWSDVAMKYMGIDKNKFPEIKRACEYVGTVSKKAALQTGLKEGTPVVVGAGDMPAGLLGAGLVREGTCVDLIGTGTVSAVFSDHAMKDEKIANFRCASPGWSPYLSMDSSGGAYRWFRDVMGKAEYRDAQEKGIQAFEYLNRFAAKVQPGSQGVMFFPYLQGERTRGTSYSKATFTGMTPATTIGHLARAVMEGVSYECRAAYELLDKQNKIEKVTLTGGAAKGDVWSQIKADIYGKPVVTLKQKETTAFGSALLAAIAAGEYKDEIEAADATVISDKIFEPNITNCRIYDELYEVFKDMHEAIQKPYVKLGKILEAQGGADTKCV